MEQRQVIDLTLPDKSPKTDDNNTPQNQILFDNVLSNVSNIDSVSHGKEGKTSFVGSKVRDNSPGLPKSNLLTTIVKFLFTSKTNQSNSRVGGQYSSAIQLPQVPHLTLPAVNHEFVSAGAISELTVMAQENNTCLKEMARVILDQNRVLGNIYNSVSENACNVDEITERMDHFELHLEKTVKDVQGKIDQVHKDQEDLNSELTERFEEITEYVDSRVPSITSELPTTLAQMELDVDKKLSEATGGIMITLDERFKSLAIDEKIEKACADSMKQFLDKNQELVHKDDLTSLGEKLKSPT